jgi:hypothetical protein
MPWQEAIEAALAQSETVAVFFGPSGVSPWHNEQMRLALDEAVRTRDDVRVTPYCCLARRKLRSADFWPGALGSIFGVGWTMRKRSTGSSPESRAKLSPMAPTRCPPSRRRIAAYCASRQNTPVSSLAVTWISNGCCKNSVSSTFWRSSAHRAAGNRRWCALVSCRHWLWTHCPTAGLRTAIMAYLVDD